SRGARCPHAGAAPPRRDRSPARPRTRTADNTSPPRSRAPPARKLPLRLRPASSKPHDIRVGRTPGATSSRPRSPMLPVQITARNITLSPETEADIRERAAALRLYYDRLLGCRVTVEVPHRRRHSGVLHTVRIDLTVPQGEIVIRRRPHEELRTAVQIAFNAARRRLQDHARRRRGAVKRHEPLATGRVAEYYPLAGYGVIETADGRTLYFDRSSVANGGFERLDVGTEVRYGTGSRRSGSERPGGYPAARTPDAWKWVANHSRASSATPSSAPGSSNRCVAPGTTASRLGPRSRPSACRFNSSTSKSAPPTINSVGAVTRSSAAPARSGRPPRDTMAATPRGRPAAATRAAAAPVLAPK